MVRRVSASQMLVEKPVTSASRNSFPRLSDILVNLSVKDTPKVVRRLKLVGDPIMFKEFTDKVYVPNPQNDPAIKGKTMRVAFPDADVNKSFTRIGHDDESECPWAKMGYIFTFQFAQNCLERQEDGSWEVKVLKKGKSIFKAIAKEQEFRRQNAEDDDDGSSAHFGTRTSPCVRIIAEATGKEGPQSVEYTVSFDPKLTTISDDMVELLRKAGEPSADDLVNERKNYEQDKKSDPSLPDWEDFFAYGFNLSQIFKFTVPKNSTQTEKVVATPKTFKDEDIAPDIPSGYTVSPPVEEKPKAKPVAKAAAKPEPADDEDDLDWMSED